MKTFAITGLTRAEALRLGKKAGSGHVMLDARSEGRKKKLGFPAHLLSMMAEHGAEEGSGGFLVDGQTVTGSATFDYENAIVVVACNPPSARSSDDGWCGCTH